jgi:hypothetical protein
VPSEVRYLTFSPSETLAAVRELRRRRGNPLVAGAVKVAKLTTDVDIDYRLVIAPNDGGPDREYLIDATELGAALVFFCINRGIPLPASARKSIRISGGAPVLVISQSASRVQLQRLFHTPHDRGVPQTTPDPPEPPVVDPRAEP